MIPGIGLVLPNIFENHGRITLLKSYIMCMYYVIVLLKHVNVKCEICNEMFSDSVI